MIKRKELKKNAKITLKKHYLLFLFICLISAFIGSEFRGSLIFTDGIKKDISNQISHAITKVSEDNNLNLNNSEIINTINENLEPITNNEITKTITEKVEPINENIRSIQETTKNETLKLKGEKGVFANFINSISSNDLIVTISKGILSIIDSENIAYMIAIITAILLYLTFSIFIIEVFKVIERRIFLEGRLYKNIPSQHFTFLIKAKKVIKVAFTMFIIGIRRGLWIFTIIMYPIKYYEYYMTSFIIAENPTISASDAINLSKKIMNGNKFKTFILDLSFLLLNILGYLTLGLFNIFYTNPYRLSTYSELYAHLRKNALEQDKNIETYLNDKYLFEKASCEAIKATYSDISEIKENITKPAINAGKIRNYLLKNFGINTCNSEETKMYEDYMIAKLKVEEYKEEMELNAYPSRLSPLELKERKTRIIDIINYLKPYSISSLITMFFIMCLIGWTWEVILNIITSGEFVNKGMLHGPWLPIYGSGGILILTFLYRFRKNPKNEFLITILLCGTVEYFTGFVIELINNGKRWWDYTGYFLNLQGRICAEGLLAFGIGGIIIVYFAAPLIDNLIRKINPKILFGILSILLTIFILDLIYSVKNPNTGKGITEYSYNHYIENYFNKT